MTVKARLRGHSFDLDALCELFKGGPTIVINQDDEGYFLSAPELEGLYDDITQLIEKSTKLISRANGIARALDPNFRPVELDDKYTDGDRRNNVVRLGIVEERSTVFAVAVVASGSTPVTPPPLPAPRFAQVANGNTEVDEVLEWLSKADGDDTWSCLYKVYEIIRANVGGTNPGTAKQRLVATGWVPEEHIDAFAKSANSELVSGKTARHARGVNHKPNAGTMTVSEARSLIGSLTVSWLGSL